MDTLACHLPTSSTDDVADGARRVIDVLVLLASALDEVHARVREAVDVAARAGVLAPTPPRPRPGAHCGSPRTAPASPDCAARRRTRARRRARCPPRAPRSRADCRAPADSEPLHRPHSGIGAAIARRAMQRVRGAPCRTGRMGRGWARQDLHLQPETTLRYASGGADRAAVLTSTALFDCAARRGSSRRASAKREEPESKPPPCSEPAPGEAGSPRFDRARPRDFSADAQAGAARPGRLDADRGHAAGTGRRDPRPAGYVGREVCRRRGRRDLRAARPEWVTRCSARSRATSRGGAARQPGFRRRFYSTSPITAGAPASAPGHRRRRCARRR